MSSIHDQHLNTQEVIIEISANESYIGHALHHIKENEVGWSIQHVVKVGNKTNIRWADGTKNHDKIMDNYLSYSY